MQQMNKIHHCSNLYFIPEQAKLAEWLVQNSCAEKVSNDYYDVILLIKF
jgi:acetylornithine/N-succinyldiaminopimelate aminotransferase